MASLREFDTILAVITDILHYKNDLQKKIFRYTSDIFADYHTSKPDTQEHSAYCYEFYSKR